MTEPNERMAAGYAEHDPAAFTLNKAKAEGFDPDFQASAARLEAKGVDLPPNLRLQLGYHESAKAAAAAIDKK